MWALLQNQSAGMTLYIHSQEKYLAKGTELHPGCIRIINGQELSCIHVSVYLQSECCPTFLLFWRTDKLDRWIWWSWMKRQVTLLEPFFGLWIGWMKSPFPSSRCGRLVASAASRSCPTNVSIAPVRRPRLARSLFCINTFQRYSEVNVSQHLGSPRSPFLRWCLPYSHILYD